MNLNVNIRWRRALRTLNYIRAAELGQGLFEMG